MSATQKDMKGAKKNFKAEKSWCVGDLVKSELKGKLISSFFTSSKIFKIFLKINLTYISGWFDDDENKYVIKLKNEECQPQKCSFAVF